MGLQQLHVIDLQAMRLKNSLHRRQGEVVEMFMVDGVKLGILNQMHQMRELHSDGSLRLQYHSQSRYKAVDVRDVGQHVVADDQVVLSIL